MHTFYCNPKDGNLNLEHPVAFREAVKLLRRRRHVIEIREYTDRRSLGANAYYWAVVIAHFMEETGLVDSQSNREYMHYDVLGQELRMVDDELRPGKQRMAQTHTMTASEFWKYIRRCELLFHDFFNGSFPPPRSLGYDTAKP